MPAPCPTAPRRCISLCSPSACGAGDEVITVSHTFIACANAIHQCGATPVFIDIEPVSYGMDAALIAAAVTPKTRAILCVHQIGIPCDMDAIMAVARAHGLKVVEDAACALGSEMQFGGSWRRVGDPAGDVACFSLHPRKVVTVGDGGMLTTQDAALDARFRLLRQHGMTVPDTVRHGSPQVIFESYEAAAFNYRLTDIQAAVGIEQLKRLPGDRFAPARSGRALPRTHRGRNAGGRRPVEPQPRPHQLADLTRCACRTGRTSAR